MEEAVNSQITDLVERTESESGEVATLNQSDSSETEQSLQSTHSLEKENEREAEGYLKIPSGAIADIKRKAREAGRQEALLQIQREYEALQKQQEVNSGEANSSPPAYQPQPAHYPPPQDQNYLIQEANWIEEKGLEKYKGNQFDPKLGTVIGSFEHVVINPIRQDPFSRQVATEIMKGDFPFDKEDVLYKVFSDPEFIRDLRDTRTESIRRKVQNYLWNSHQKQKPVSRPANPPLSEIKTSANAKQVDKEPTFAQRIAMYEKRSR